MASNASEKELVEIFEKAMKAADKASADEYRKADEQRCVVALKALYAFPVTPQFLLATQLGKRLRTLTKHPLQNIGTVASELLDTWKKAVARQIPGLKSVNSEDSSQAKCATDKISAEKEEKKPSRELSAEFNPKGPPKLPINEPWHTQSEEKPAKSVTLNNVSADKEEKKRKLELSAEFNTNPPPKLPNLAKRNYHEKATMSEEKKPRRELSAESNPKGPPKLPSLIGNKSLKSEENQAKSATVKISAAKEEKKNRGELSAESNPKCPPKLPSLIGNKSLMSEDNQSKSATFFKDNQAKSATFKIGAEKQEKKPSRELSAESNPKGPSKLPSHIGNKSLKSEDNQAKSATVNISAEKEEKKPRRELSAESNPKALSKLPSLIGNKSANSEDNPGKSATFKISAEKEEKKLRRELSAESNPKLPNTVKYNEPLRTISEEKQAKFVTFNKVSAEKEGKKRKLELSPEFNTKRPPKIPTLAKSNDQKKAPMSEEKKPQQLELSSLSNLNQPRELPSTAKCNDQWRNKVRESLLEAFSKVVHEAQGEELVRVRGFDPVRVAVDVETVMFNKLGRSDGTLKLKAKYRSILFNLKADKNPDLRRRVFTGEIEAERLIVMTSEELASDARKFENDKIKNKALYHCERGIKKVATTTEFKCGRCGEKQTEYYQLQTRSADEPMTTYVTCINCNNRWKFC